MGELALMERDRVSSRVGIGFESSGNCIIDVNER